MLLNEIVQASLQVASTRSRKTKIQVIGDLLSDRDEDETATVVGWLSGAMAQGRIGVGYATVMQLADVAPADAPSLAIQEIDATFDRIKETAGAGSKKRKADLLRNLMARATESEQRFLRALLTGELRQGALAGIMADAIAKATGTPAAAVRRAAMLSGDLRRVAVAARADGVPGLAAFGVELFRPLQPMLAQTAEGPTDALEALGVAAFELKLDGARIQVHRRGDEVQVFTRRLKPVTGAVPEVVEAALAMPCREVILDGEVLALKPDGAPHTFQTTMRRFGRKLQARVASLRDELPLTPFFFDCLLLDGQELIDAPTEERIEAMTRVVAPEHRVPRLVTDDAAEASEFLGEAIDAGHEGVMAKALAAPYAAGSRGAAWLKIKPIHTLDLVVLAVDWGSGRRKGWLSNLHLGARDPQTGRFVMLGKTFKGMTDALLTWQTERFQELETHRTDWTVHVRPEQVVEIAFNEIQTSPRYPGGLALRFARVKGYRHDKTADEADTIDTVRAIHEGRLRPGPPGG